MPPLSLALPGPSRTPLQNGLARRKIPQHIRAGNGFGMFLSFQSSLRPALISGLMPDTVVWLENLEKQFPGTRRPALAGLSAEIRSGIVIPSDSRTIGIDSDNLYARTKSVNEFFADISYLFDCHRCSQGSGESKIASSLTSGHWVTPRQ